MVFIKDEGSVFEAPIDALWKYIQLRRRSFRKSETGSLSGRGSRPDVSVWATTHGKRVRGKPGRRGHDRRDRLRSTRDLSPISDCLRGGRSRAGHGTRTNPAS